MSVDKTDTSSKLSWYKVLPETGEVTYSTAAEYIKNKPPKADREVTPEHIKIAELKYVDKSFWNGDKPIVAEKLQKMAEESGGKEFYLTTTADVPPEKLSFASATTTITGIPQNIQNVKDFANKINEQNAINEPETIPPPSREV